MRGFARDELPVMDDLGRALERFGDHATVSRRCGGSSRCSCAARARWCSPAAAASSARSASRARSGRPFGLQPHRQQTWKLSKDPQFIDTVRDVVGLYLNPPERAVVLCVDEKSSQIQALDRTAAILPMLPGTPERATHDYKRAGTSSLYAALDLTTGKVIGRLHGRHRAIEFKQFLQTLDREVPAHLDVHLILDNSSTHKTPAIQRWPAAHPDSSCTSPPPAPRG